MPTALHRRILGPHWPAPPVSEADLFFSVVNLHPPARRTLRQQLTASGTWQIGHLFGHVNDGALQITSAAAVPCPGVDADSYGLGALDACRALDARTDWVGCWLTAPDGRPPTLADALNRFDDGQLTAVFAEQRILLTVGTEDGRLEFLALRALDIDLSPEILPVALIP